MNLKYLVIRMSSLGDVVLATPVAIALKHADPTCEVHFLTESQYAPILENGPWFDRVIPYDKRGFDAGMVGIIRISNILRAEKYDVTIDLQHKVRSVLLATLSGAVGRIVMRKRTLRGGIRGIAGVGFSKPEIHAVDMYLGVLEQLGIFLSVRTPWVGVDPVDLSRMVEKLGGKKGHRAPVVGINTGAGNATKRVPVPIAMAVARRLQDAKIGVVLLGGRSDSGFMHQISSGLEFSPVLTTQHCSLKELVAVVSELDVLVSGDSGPIHLASAFGVPTVALFGPTSPKRWGPLSPFNEVIVSRLECAPCSNYGGMKCPKGLDTECMKTMASETIVSAVKGFLGDGRI